MFFTPAGRGPSPEAHGVGGDLVDGFVKPAVASGNGSKRGPLTRRRPISVSRSPASGMVIASLAVAAANGGLSWARTRRSVPRSTRPKRIWLGGHLRVRLSAAGSSSRGEPRHLKANRRDREEWDLSVEAGVSALDRASSTLGSRAKGGASKDRKDLATMI